MKFSELTVWQWATYDDNHRDRRNLLIHVVAVPLFWTGCASLVLAVVFGSVLYVGCGAVALVLSLILQGRGHKLERVPPVPFKGPGDFIGRIFIEQWITFPRFVLTGGWWRNFSGRSGA